MKLSKMKLSKEQQNFFETFGYLLIPQLFSPEETEKIIENFEWSIQNSRRRKKPRWFPSHHVSRPPLSVMLRCARFSTTLRYLTSLEA